jgi:alpha-tubulin suppressor-like RCC1 family protein
MNDQSLQCWGWNQNGQVGTGSITYDVTAPQVIYDPSRLDGTPLRVDDVATGGTHTCALSGRDLFCWGSPMFEADGGMTATPMKVPWP